MTDLANITSSPVPSRYSEAAMRVRVRDIQEAVAGRFGIRLIEMSSHRRSRSVARPRQVAIYLARHLTPLSLAEIGRHFGGRDHTTILHAIRRIEELADIDQDIADAIAAIRDGFADPNQLPLPLA